jgi:hypothetical protein
VEYPECGIKIMMDIGPQYKPDDSFKAAARLHQSQYRANVLNVDYLDYGNRLTEIDGRALLNYYDGLGVREALRGRYPFYSGKRDADMLRSEHIPFNLMAPLAKKPVLMQLILKEAFGLELRGPIEMRLEWAPSPAVKYLGDMTSFDVYIQGKDGDGESVGIGIEVKYTERGYRIGNSEAGECLTETLPTGLRHVSRSICWRRCVQLAQDDLRQIWRNHLLGLTMVRNKDIARFKSVILYPAGNKHFTHSLMKYQNLLEARMQGMRFTAAHSSII